MIHVGRRAAHLSLRLDRYRRYCSRSGRNVKRPNSTRLNSCVNRTASERLREVRAGDGDSLAAGGKICVCVVAEGDRDSRTGAIPPSRVIIRAQASHYCSALDCRRGFDIDFVVETFPCHRIGQVLTASRPGGTIYRAAHRVTMNSCGHKHGTCSSWRDLRALLWGQVPHYDTYLVTGATLPIWCQVPYLVYNTGSCRALERIVGTIRRKGLREKTKDRSAFSGTARRHGEAIHILAVLMMVMD